MQDRPHRRRQRIGGSSVRCSGDSGAAPTWLPLMGSVGIVGGLLALVITASLLGSTEDAGSYNTPDTPSPTSTPAE